MYKINSNPVKKTYFCNDIKISKQMKHTILSLAIMLTTQTAFAQKVRTVDAVDYRITYSAKTVEDVNEKDESGGYRYEDDELRLDIGKTISKCYNRTRELHDSVMLAKLNNFDLDMTGTPANGAISWIIYKGVPAGKTIRLDVVGACDDHYRMEEDTDVPEWKIESDSTLNVLGYDCMKAVAAFKGRTWTAYFTEDIPLDNGPWKLCGLPGLILKAEDTTHQFIFEAIGLQQLNGSQPITYNAEYDSYEKITLQHFNEISSKYRIADAFEGRLPVRVEDANGNDITAETLRKMNEVMPYNPIER